MVQTPAQEAVAKASSAMRMDGAFAVDQRSSKAMQEEDNVQREIENKANFQKNLAKRMQDSAGLNARRESITAGNLEMNSTMIGIRKIEEEGAYLQLAKKKVHDQYYNPRTTTPGVGGDQYMDPRRLSIMQTMATVESAEERLDSGAAARRGGKAPNRRKALQPPPREIGRSDEGTEEMRRIRNLVSRVSNAVIFIHTSLTFVCHFLHLELNYQMALGEGDQDIMRRMSAMYGPTSKTTQFRKRAAKKYEDKLKRTPDPALYWQRWLLYIFSHRAWDVIYLTLLGVWLVALSDYRDSLRFSARPPWLTAPCCNLTFAAELPIPSLIEIPWHERKDDTIYLEKVIAGNVPLKRTIPHPLSCSCSHAPHPHSSTPAHANCVSLMTPLFTPPPAELDPWVPPGMRLVRTPADVDDQDYIWYNNNCPLNCTYTLPTPPPAPTPPPTYQFRPFPAATSGCTTCGGAVCSFDNGDMCGYSQETTGPAWVWAVSPGHSSTHSMGTGPAKGQGGDNSNTCE
jgi:hypothetical protein